MRIRKRSRGSIRPANGLAGQTVIQQPDVMLLEMLAELGPVSVAVAGELKKERPVMASVRQVEDAATCRQAMGP